MSEKNHVLIVDDDAHVRLTVRTILGAEGFEVSAAASGEECLKCVKEGFTGVILLDIMMPGMDGWDTIEAIVRDGLFRGIVIAMLTAKSVPDTKMIGLQEYVTDYITKPFESEELIQKTVYLQKFV